MAKINEIMTLLEETARRASASPKDWMSYLDTAARLYRYPFRDALLIHAQRPDAFACAELDVWNRSMNRWVNLGARGIALIDDVHLTTDADEMEKLYERAKRLPDTIERLEILKKAYNLYHGRLFEAGEGELGAWAIPFTMHYSQIFVDVTRELLAILGRQKDYHSIIEFGSKAIRMEPGIQDAYYWVIHAAEKIGNGATRDLCLTTAKEELTEEEYGKLMQMLNETRDD